MKTDVLATQINETLGTSTNLGAMQRKVNHKCVLQAQKARGLLGVRCSGDKWLAGGPWKLSATMVRYPRHNFLLPQMLIPTPLLDATTEGLS